MLLVIIFLGSAKEGFTQPLLPDTVYSFSELKMDSDRDSEPDLIGRQITVSGIANIGSSVLHEQYLQIFIQNDSSGISLFSDSIKTPVNRGDRVIASGKIQEYYGLTEVKVDSYSVFKAGETIEPIPILKIFENLSKYEGMLVSGEGEVTGKGTQFNGKHIHISPGDRLENTIMVFISNFHSKYGEFDFDRLSIGDNVSVTGILSLYEPGGSTQRTFKIFLRTPDDLTVNGIPRKYIGWGFGGLILIALLVAAWIGFTRYRVKNKTEALSSTLKEKDMLLREIHHRVKNNLAIVSGLIDLQVDTTEDPAAKMILENTRSRIQAMAMVHNKLYQSSTLSDIDMNIYLTDIAEGIHRTFVNENTSIDLELDVEPVKLQIDQAIPCGLLVNELMVNAYKHAFDEVQQGKLAVRLHSTDQKVKLQIEDNGSGLPDNFDLKSTESLGTMLIDTFSQQLDAEIKVESNGFTRFLFEFPLKNS